MIPYEHTVIIFAMGDKYPEQNNVDRVEARIVENLTGIWRPTIDDRDEELINRIEIYSIGKDHVHADSPYHFLRVKAPRINKIYVTDVRDEEEVKKFNKYGGTVYVKRHNLFGFWILKIKITNLENKMSIASNLDQKMTVSFKKEIEKLEDYLKPLEEWLIGNGYEDDIIKLLSKLHNSNDSNVKTDVNAIRKDLIREVELRGEVIKKQSKKLKYVLGNMSNEELSTIAYSTRKLNGKINYAAIARELGYHATTVRSEFKRRNMTNLGFTSRK